MFDKYHITICTLIDSNTHNQWIHTYVTSNLPSQDDRYLPNTRQPTNLDLLAFGLLDFLV